MDENKLIPTPHIVAYTDILWQSDKLKEVEVLVAALGANPAASPTTDMKVRVVAEIFIMFFDIVLEMIDFAVLWAYLYIEKHRMCWRFLWEGTSRNIISAVAPEIGAFQKMTHSRH